MKNTKHIILTSLMGLLVSTAYAMEENAVVGNAQAGQHAAAHGPQMMSWEAIDRLKMVAGQNERANQLLLAKIDAEAAHGPQMMTWDAIDRLKMVDHERANQLLLAKIDAEAAHGPQMMTWDAIDRLRMVDHERANQI
jgi:hypothetical protein